MNTSIKTLPRANAFFSGADLWISADREHSLWTDQIDWLTGFQALSSTRRDGFSIHSEVDKIQKKYNCDEVNISVSDHAPLLISTSRNLPNRHLLVLPMGESAMDWILSCFKAWLQLDKPNLRVFLPDSLPDESFCKHWPEKQSRLGSISLVPGFH